MGDFTYENNLVPKFPSQVIRNAEIIEGNRGPGTIKETIFVEGIGPMNHTKQISDDGVAQESLSFNYTFGGDRNNGTFSNISGETKTTTTPDGGYRYQRSQHSESYTVTRGNATGTEGFKTIENRPHPHAYN
ncbi:hypothetical protein ACJW31_02G016300 [Castanea mollissima]